MLRKRKNRQAREEEYNIRPNDCKIGHALSLSPCSGYGVFAVTRFFFCLLWSS